MKYIKKFNESATYKLYDTPIRDLHKFCEDHLAFIIDEGFKVEIGSTRSFENHKLSIEIKKVIKESFNYNDIKNDFIPFLEEFVRVYEIDTGIPKEKIDYYNRYPESKFKNRTLSGSGYGIIHRTDLPEICKVQFIYKSKVKEVYNVQQIIDDSVKSILHKDKEYNINVGEIDSIIIKL
jgi:hypothetical protein